MKRQFFLFILALIFASFNPLHANKWRVSSTPGIDADFKLFKTAHDAAEEGDTLMFEGSNLFYGEYDTLDKKLVIVGPGYFLSDNDMSNDHILPASFNYLYVDSAAKGSVIMGMSFAGGFDCLQIDASDIVIERNHVDGRITFCYHKPIINGIVSKNFATDIGTRWGYGDRFSTGLLITNNIVKGSIGFHPLSTSTITNNTVGEHINASSSIVKNNISGYLNGYDGTAYQYNIVSHDAPSGTGNIGDLGYDGIFVTDEESTDGSYNLSATSPAKGAGEGGIDCGAFGGNDPYILSGYPPFPFIYNVVIPSTGIDKITIQIEARSQR